MKFKEVVEQLDKEDAESLGASLGMLDNLPKEEPEAAPVPTENPAPEAAEKKETRTKEEEKCS